jgi:hypothetical protein
VSGADHFAHYDRPTLTEMIETWNAELRRYRADPVISNNALAGVPIAQLRALAAATVDRLTAVGSALGPWR